VKEMSDISISVIIPVFNNEQYIAEALESVLDQTEKPVEIIVVDSSNDRTPEIVRSFSNHIRHYFFKSRLEIGQARNFGINQAIGNFFAHLDGDDIWMENKLEFQMNAFREDPDLDVVGGMMKSFISPELAGEERKNIYCSPNPKPGFSASVMVVRREAFFRVGSYKTELRVGVDLDWFVRAREMDLKEKMIYRVLAKRRLHKTNTDLLNKQYANERIRVLKESLDRRRNASGVKSEK
jgi:glycosyltransferase involved in cell wall biosynthesis